VPKIITFGKGVQKIQAKYALASLFEPLVAGLLELTVLRCS